MAEIETTLHEVLSVIASKLQYEPHNSIIVPISSGGANYTSSLFQATLTAPLKEDLYMFAKVAAIGENMRTEFGENIFKSEIYFYTQLLKKYRDIEDKFKVPSKYRLDTAKFYGCNDEYLKETVVLEDLTKTGYQAFNRFQPIDWKYASQSVKQLAIFHALSLALSKYDSEEFEKTKVLLKSESDREKSMGFWKNVINEAFKVIKEEYKERLSKFLENKTNVQDFDDFYRPLTCSIIIHGDYRPSNLMQRFNEDRSLKVVPVDYQTLRHGSPIIDLLYFICTGSDKKFRQQHMSATIELYYKELCDALRRFDIDPDTVYKRENFDYEYNKLLPLGLSLSLVSLLIITVETEKAPQANTELTLNDFAIKPNDFYQERINDIVEDFINMGIL